MSIILFQSLLIVWLSTWAVEDYLNNQYVRAYVDGVIQVEGWLFGVFAFLGVLGSVMGLVVRRRRGAKGLELIDTGSESLEPRSSGLKGPMSASTVVARTQAAAASSRPSVELHPAVAALKAELSEARMSLGLASVTPGPEKSPAVTFNDQKTSVGLQPSPMMRSPMMGPRPQFSVMRETPPTVIRPGPQPTGFRPVPPPNVIRPMMPPSPAGSVPSSPTMPVLKIEGKTPQGPSQTVGLLSKQEGGPMAQKNVSTVITGIVPVQQKKKEEPESSSGQNSSQQ